MLLFGIRATGCRTHGSRQDFGAPGGCGFQLQDALIQRKWEGRRISPPCKSGCVTREIPIIRFLPLSASVSVKSTQHIRPIPVRRSALEIYSVINLSTLVDGFLGRSVDDCETLAIERWV